MHTTSGRQAIRSDCLITTGVGEGGGEGGFQVQKKSQILTVNLILPYRTQVRVYMKYDFGLDAMPESGAVTSKTDRFLGWYSIQYFFSFDEWATWMVLYSTLCTLLKRS